MVAVTGVPRAGGVAGGELRGVGDWPGRGLDTGGVDHDVDLLGLAHLAWKEHPASVEEGGSEPDRSPPSLGAVFDVSLGHLLRVLLLRHLAVQALWLRVHQGCQPSIGVVRPVVHVLSAALRTFDSQCGQEGRVGVVEEFGHLREQRGAALQGEHEEQAHDLGLREPGCWALSLVPTVLAAPPHEECVEVGHLHHVGGGLPQVRG